MKFVGILESTPVGTHEEIQWKFPKEIEKGFLEHILKWITREFSLKTPNGIFWDVFRRNPGEIYQ